MSGAQEVTPDRSAAYRSVGQQIFAHSFAYLLVVALICLIGAVVLTMARMERQAHQSVLNTMEVMQPSVVREAWQINIVGMDTILRSLVSSPQIMAARYVDETMDRVARSTDDGAAPVDWSRCDEVIRWDLKGVPIQGTTLPSGALWVCYRSSFTFGSFLYTLLGAGIPIVFFVFLGAAGPAFFAKRHVVDPVRRLTGYLSTDGPLPDRDSARGAGFRGDEIDQLYQELNTRTRAIQLERDVSSRAFAFLIDGVAVCDADFVVQRCNAALCQLLNASEARLIGQDIRGRLPQEAFARPLDFIDCDLPDGRSFEICHRRIAAEGVPDLVIVVVRDRTEQKRSERDRLQTQKMVALGTLSGGVAHDFNNLLAVISGAAELLETAPGSPEERADLLQEIRVATRHGKNLTEQLLSYARRSDLNHERVRLADLLDNTVTMAQRMVGSLYPISVTRDSNAVLETDRSAFETSILNLILNARDALGQGGEIGIAARDHLGKDGTRMVAITVRNGGPPIPTQILTRMTEPFFTTKGPGKGTGLGLSMVAGFVRQEGGDIEIASNAVNGTQVTLLMPAASAHSGDDASDAPTQDRPDADTPPRRVLLVEDLDNVRRMTTLMLTRLGHRVDAVNGIGALRAMLAQGDAGWDIVLCDYALEGHTGLDVVQMLRGAGVSAPVHILSGYLSSDVSDQLLTAGVVDVLTKPVPLALLRDVLAAPTMPRQAAADR